MRTFNHTDTGCYADGSAGHQHIRDTLGYMVSEYGEVGDALFWALTNDEPSDDLSEEEEAIELLQEHTSDGLIWDMVEGDLILLTLEQYAELMAL